MEVIIVKIKALPNGPYLAESKEKGKVALCRCGQSKNKPYCDGSHAQAKFQADSAEIDL
jgi:CDGSH-type Zn-finger protein